MNRVSRPEVEPLPSMKLYREDLERLFALFKATCQHVTLSDDDYSYESVDEMASNAKTITALHISGAVPHAELLIKGARKTKLRVQRSTLWTVQPNEKSRLLFLEARNLLLERRWHMKEILSVGAIVLGLVLTFGSAVVRPIVREHFMHGELDGELAGLLGIALLVVGIVFYFERVSYISLESRSRLESFWKRNSDKILLSIVSAAIGAVFALLIKWLTG